MSILHQSHSTSGDLTERTKEPDLLEFEDIQHFLMTRPPARAARYEFLRFGVRSGGRAWLTGLIDKVGTASAVGSSLLDSRWVTVGFTWNGLQALGVDEHHWPPSRKSSVRAWQPGRASSAPQARIIRIIGWEDLPVLTCMRLSYCLPAMSPNASGAGRSMQTI